MNETRATLEEKAREALSDEIKTGLHVPFYVQPHVLVNILDERDALLDAAKRMVEVGFDADFYTDEENEVIDALEAAIAKAEASK